jgi:hypothetical protein
MAPPCVRREDAQAFQGEGPQEYVSLSSGDTRSLECTCISKDPFLFYLSQLG